MNLKEEFLLLKYNSYKDNIILFLLCVLAMFPILPPAVQSIGLGAFCCLSVMFYYQRFLGNIKKINLIYWFLILTGYYIFSLISYFWSENKIQFWNEIQPNLVLLILPFIFIFFIKFPNDVLKIIVFFHLFSLCVYGILWILKLIESIQFYHLNINDSYSIYKLEGIQIDEIGNNFSLFIILVKNFFFKFKSYSNILYEVQNIKHNDFFQYHYAYISSLYLNGILLVFSYKIYMKKVFYISLIFFFSFFVFYLGSKVNVILLAIILIYFFYKNNNLKLNFLLLILILLITVLNIKKNKIVVSEKFYTVYEHKIELFDKTRIELYSSSIVIFKLYPYFGIGVGDVFNELNKNIKRGVLVEKNNKFVELGNEEKKNNHSQLLYYLNSIGLIGVLLFLFMFYKLFFINKKIIYLSLFTLIIFSNCLFENFLSRFFGSFFFAFFVLIYTKSILLYEDSNS
jgi:hypothetical protein